MATLQETWYEHLSSLISGETLPTIAHQALASLFRDSPRLGMNLFHEATGVTLPPAIRARLHNAQFTDLHPPEYSADAVYVLEDSEGQVHGALIVEVQLSPDETKRASWLQYVATLHRSLHRPVTLLVVTMSETLARWCAEPHVYDHVGSIYRPVVIAPQAIPWITDVEMAREFPALAVLSVAAHGREPGAEAIGIAAYLACGALDRDIGSRYADGVLAWLDASARHALEEYMSLHGYEYQSDFARKHVQEGRQSILIRQLVRKFGELSDSARQRIETASREELERWADRILFADTLDEVLAD